MRRLSEQEKNLCCLILRGDGPNNFLGNILDPYLPDATICMWYEREKPRLMIIHENPHRDRSEDLIFKRETELRKLLLVTVNLIQLLEREGYIMLFMPMTRQGSQMIEMGARYNTGCRAEEVENRKICSVKDCLRIGSDIQDDVVAELLIKYASREIYVTEEFRAFCENGYIPRSDIQFSQSLELTNQSLEVTKQSLEVTRKSYKVAIMALIVALLSFLVSIL